MWIRSQDRKEITKVDNVSIMETNDMQGNGKLIKRYGGYIHSYVGEGSYIRLGEYTTEKRALEVLDEIHEYIENEYMTNKTKENITRMFIANEISFETFEQKLKELKTIYEMPKE